MIQDRAIRILALVTDAYGGTGGIAQYNRDFLESLAAHPMVREIVVLPRVISREMHPRPEKITHVERAAGSKLRYVAEVVRVASRGDGFDLVICAHINLLAAAWLAARRCSARLMLMVYGIEVWESGNQIQRMMLRATDAVVSISRITAEKLKAWAPVRDDIVSLVPNAIDLDAYTPGPKREDIRARLGLGAGPVITTLGRIDANERGKGFDEILDVLPSLLEEFPTLKYCIAGDGSDRNRLERKAERLGLKPYTVFTGYLDEQTKLELYRLTDLFAMPSRLEGFGYVFLEALAVGVPVVASSVDGSREAVRGGAWGRFCDPRDRVSVREAISSSLRSPRVPDRTELQYFSKDKFRERVWQAFDKSTLSLRPR